MSSTLMLTTIDNPYNPLTEFEGWHAYDQARGYYTLALLARVTRVSENMSEEEYEAAVDAAVLEIAHYNVSGVHVAISVTK